MSTTAPLTRVARKRREARARIIEAAAGLFRARGVEAVTIQDITAAADVGHGSFYLHFKTKHEVLLPIMAEEAAALDATVQEFLPAPRDPAEVLATSSRYMASVVAGDPLWRWFLESAGLPGESLRRTFGAFSRRDLDEGFAVGRFAAADRAAASVFAFGGYVAVLMAAFDAQAPQTAIDQAAELMLCVLGLPADEARRLARRPLPGEVN